MTVGRRQLDELDAADWGPAPQAERTAAAAAANVALRTERHRQVGAGSVNVDDAADVAGVTVERIRALVASGDLATLGGDEELIPAWQLAAGCLGGVVPMLAQLRAAFPGDLVDLSLWVTKPCAEFDGRRPCDVMGAGQADAVVSYARILTAAGW